MNKIAKSILLAIVLIAVTIGAVMLLHGHDIAVLNPQGEIAMKQRDLLVFTTVLSLVVIVPVFVMLIIFSVRYNATNKKKAVYHPDWEGNKFIEVIMWGIPCVIIVILGVVTWQSSHDLDPYKQIRSDVKPLEVQVISLQWKWLFIYPEQGVATVGELYVPKSVPVNFTITSDAPMNSFWVPSLGGQVYAMNGMSTKLSLIADHTGDFRGSSANISGAGFADMNFMVHAVSPQGFNSWLHTAQTSENELDSLSYAKLAKPATLDKPLTFRLTDETLYDTIVMKYMTPSKSDGQHGAIQTKMEGMQ